MLLPFDGIIIPQIFKKERAQGLIQPVFPQPKRDFSRNHWLRANHPGNSAGITMLPSAENGAQTVSCAQTGQLQNLFCNCPV
jgi:hypothetical protein